MRILIFHGYLLGGTGSNVYNASLAAALVRAGHDVHLLCQEPHPEDLPFVDAVGAWAQGRLSVEVLREPVRCTVYRPDIGGLLPVYVADRYEGVEAKPFPELSEDEVAAYLDRNVAAVREVAERMEPEAALANHLIMGPAILARAGLRFAMKVHGSALEYTVKPHPRFLPCAREGTRAARAVLVGSRHTAQSLWAALSDPDLPGRTLLGPPGVDIAAFAPRDPGEAAAGVVRLGERLAAAAPPAQVAAPAGDAPPVGAAPPAQAVPPAQAARPPTETSFTRDTAAAARAVASLCPGRDRLVVFVGKLIVSKGIDLLLASWPLVRARVPDARLAVVGFGAWEEQARRLQDALVRGDLGEARAIAREGRAAEGGPAKPLGHLLAFLDAVDPDDLGDVSDGVVFTGRLEHSELAELLPAAEALVVPSTFPEAFGMVAAEAAACGALPIVAAHSGLAEVAAVLAERLPEPARPWLTFPLDDEPVRGVADRVTAWLGAPEETRARSRDALVATAREHFSWDGVARGVLAAAEGRLTAPELRPLG